MTKISIILLGISLLFLSAISKAQIPDNMYSPLCRIHQKIGMTDIEIVYSRPGLKGRKLWGELIKEGVEWRTGANAATTIRFDDEVILSGQKLKPGIYSLYTIPGRVKWIVIFNTEIYNDPYEGRIKDKDALQLEIPVVTLNQLVETFTIGISDLSKDLVSGSIDLAWENTLIKIPFQVPAKWGN